MTPKKLSVARVKQSDAHSRCHIGRKRNSSARHPALAPASGSLLKIPQNLHDSTYARHFTPPAQPLN
jgi:hypothetical protein